MIGFIIKITKNETISREAFAYSSCLNRECDAYESKRYKENTFCSLCGHKRKDTYETITEHLYPTNVELYNKILKPSKYHQELNNQTIYVEDNFFVPLTYVNAFPSNGLFSFNLVLDNVFNFDEYIKQFPTDENSSKFDFNDSNMFDMKQIDLLNKELIFCSSIDGSLLTIPLPDFEKEYQKAREKSPLFKFIDDELKKLYGDNYSMGFGFTEIEF